MRRLVNKVAVITGSGSGQGQTAAILFAKEGAKVVIVDKPGLVYDRKEMEGEIGRTIKSIKDAGGEASFVEADVSKAVDVENMIEFTVGTYGKLDILYNNAGITPPAAGGVVDILEEAWDKVMNYNLKSVYLCCKYGIPELLKSGGGSIINTASTAAVVAYTDLDSYTASKAAMIALTKAIAVKYGPDNVRANVIAPGTVDSPMSKPTLAIKEFRETLERYTPIPRIATCEDIARVALHLASDESSFTTGVVYVVDGGSSSSGLGFILACRALGTSNPWT